MQTQCNPEQYEFSGIERRRVVAGFDAGQVTSDSGALLLKQVDEVIRFSERTAACFIDGRKRGVVIRWSSRSARQPSNCLIMG
jgi:hypothetical protein